MLYTINDTAKWKRKERKYVNTSETKKDKNLNQDANDKDVEDQGKGRV